MSTISVISYNILAQLLLPNSNLSCTYRRGDEGERGDITPARPPPTWIRLESAWNPLEFPYKMLHHLDESPKYSGPRQGTITKSFLLMPTAAEAAPRKAADVAAASR